MKYRRTVFLCLILLTQKKLSFKNCPLNVSTMSTGKHNSVFDQVLKRKEIISLFFNCHASTKKCLPIENDHWTIIRLDVSSRSPVEPTQSDHTKVALLSTPRLSVPKEFLVAPLSDSTSKTWSSRRLMCLALLMQRLQRRSIS